MSSANNKSDFPRYCVIVILSVIAFLAPIWLWIAREPLTYLDKEYPMWLAKMDLIRTRQVGGLVILGDSRPVAGLIPARIGPGVVNLSFGGGTPIDAYYATQEIVTGTPVPKAVIISFAVDHFNGAEVFWGRSVEFGFLDLQEINEVRSRSRALKDNSIFGVESPCDLDARLEGFLYGIKFPSYYFPAFIQYTIYGGDNRYAGNRKMFDLVLSNRGQGYFGSANGSTEPESDGVPKSFVPSRILDDYFNRTLAILQSRNVPVYFISMPHNAASERLYVPKVEKDFAIYLKNYSGRYPNFRILGDLFPSYPSEYFGDPSHLNKRGAILWSTYVAHLLNDSRVSGGPFGL